MRTISKIAAVTLVASMALTGCGKKNNTNASGPTDPCTGFSGSGPKVGMAFDVGGIGDHSFNDAAVVGIKKAMTDVGASCVDTVAQGDESDAKRADRLTQLAGQGATAIVGVGFSYSNAVNTVAPNYPNIHFLVIDGFDPDNKTNPNVAYASFAANQAAYLVGMAAALKSQTHHVGFIGGVNIPLIQAFQAGYDAGAKAADPTVKIDDQYIEESNINGFYEPDKAKTIAEGMYDKGADVIYHAAGQAGDGLFEAAAEMNKWAIGTDSDQYTAEPANEQPHILTSALKRVDTAVYDFVQSESQSKHMKSYVTFDLSNDGVGFSTSGGFIDDIKPQLDAAAAKIVSGQIKVPDSLS